MQKFLTIISIVLLFFFVAPTRSNAQVVTEIDSISVCYHAFKSVPVVVQNMTAVDSLRLNLTFEGDKVECAEYFGAHEALAAGNFVTTIYDDSVVITWSAKTSVTLPNDTLVSLRFKGLAGTSILGWNISSSFYHTSTGNLPAVFVDGKAVVNPKINLVLTELTPTCPKTCDANFQAEASGGTPPYKYLWNGKPSQYDFIKKYLCAGKNHIRVTDKIGCIFDSAYTINGLPGAKVKMIVEGNQDTTLYVENPVLAFSFEEVPPTHVIEPPLWDFGDGDTARSFHPVHIFDKANTVTGTNPSYTVKLHVYNENGCDSIIEKIIPIRVAKLKIPGVITPNADSKNDVFLILNENKTGSGEDIKITNEYQHMELVIFDRWGRKVYETQDYKSDWIAEGVPDGSYYYILKTVGFYTTETHKGSLTILGSGITQ